METGDGALAGEASGSGGIGACNCVVARLLSHGVNLTNESADLTRCTSLPTWRLEFIEAHLEETVALKDMAASASVTRMHFAAPFRFAMGTSPHER